MITSKYCSLIVFSPCYAVHHCFTTSFSTVLNIDEPCSGMDSRWTLSFENPRKTSQKVSRRSDRKSSFFGIATNV